MSATSYHFSLQAFKAPVPEFEISGAIRLRLFTSHPSAHSPCISTRCAESVSDFDPGRLVTAAGPDWIARFSAAARVSPGVSDEDHVSAVGASHANSTQGSSTGSRKTDLARDGSCWKKLAYSISRTRMSHAILRVSYGTMRDLPPSRLIQDPLHPLRFELAGSASWPRTVFVQIRPSSNLTSARTTPTYSHGVADKCLRLILGGRSHAAPGNTQESDSL